MMDYALLFSLALMAGAFSLWCPCGYSIAETVTHTVSGWQQLRVRTILALCTGFSAAVFGFATGLSLLPFGTIRVSPLLIGVLALIALVADELSRHWNAF